MDILRCIHHIFRNYKEQGKRLFFFVRLDNLKMFFFRVEFIRESRGSSSEVHWVSGDSQSETKQLI